MRRRPSGYAPVLPWLMAALAAAFPVAAAAESGERTTGETVDEDQFVRWSASPAPDVDYALQTVDDILRVTLRIASPEGTVVRDVRFAAAIDGRVNNGQVIVPPQRPRDDAGRVTIALGFPAPAEDTGEIGDAGNVVEEKFRLAVAVTWSRADRPQDAYRHERFGTRDRRAPHAPLGVDPDAWQPIDLDEYRRAVDDRKNQLRIRFTQPLDGKTTVVVEDADGRRVRNLLHAHPYPQGEHTVVWDGLDENGVLVPPGAYRWRALHHPGIVPEFVRTFANGGETFFEGFGSNHMRFTEAHFAPAVNALPEQLLLAAPMTEGGHAVIALRPDDGAWLWGARPPHGLGMGVVHAAHDDRFFYLVQDGAHWGQRVDRAKEGWSAPYEIRLARIDRANGRMVDFPRNQRFLSLDAYVHGPGSDLPATRDRFNLAGAALLKGQLHVASRARQAVLVFDVAALAAAQPGTPPAPVRTIPLPDPGPLAVHDGFVYAFSGATLLRLDAAGHTLIWQDDALTDPRGLAIADDGGLYASDGAAHRVFILKPDAKKDGLGVQPGGPYAGAYQPERLVRPRGLAVAGTRLWITEQRDWPKRVTAWNLDTGTVALEKFGNPPYGSPTAGVDPRDPARWIAMGAEWRIDLDGQAENVRSILANPPGHLEGAVRPDTIKHYRLHIENGREFWIGTGKTSVLSERRPDGTFHDWAAIADYHQFEYSTGWNTPAAFRDAYVRAFPGQPYPGRNGPRGVGVLWVDRNGDNQLQADEFDFIAPPVATRLAGGGWGHNQRDLTVELPVHLPDGASARLRLAPRGFLPNGCPDYPSLAEAFQDGLVRVAWSTAVPPVRSITTESMVDRQRRLVVNSDPFMVGLAPDGRELWRYPNQWTNVHGSHKAPLPEPGVLQGALFFLGDAPLDDEADVFVVNGNHGRFFAMTTDGFYLDEFFNDVRMGAARDAWMVGGEAFGGSFARADDGTYYLQTGSNGFRIYRLRGLDRASRSHGVLDATPARIAAAERAWQRVVAAAPRGERRALVARAATPPSMDPARAEGWPSTPMAEWSRGDVAVRATWLYDDDHLYLDYAVRDPSPWKNNGDDWTLLFKTGDSIDLQLGLDPDASDRRKGPVPGDVRLLIAPFDGKPLAVVYRHRVPGTREPVTFSSPWRHENVDRVDRAEGADVRVRVERDRYTVRASIPWAALGGEAARLAGKTVRGDVGVILGDAEGTVNLRREYWANPATGLVNDVPGEVQLSPGLWGRVVFAP